MRGVRGSAQKKDHIERGSQSQQIRIHPESSSSALRGWFLSHTSQFKRAKDSDQPRVLQIVIHTRYLLRWARIGHESKLGRQKSPSLLSKRGILILTLNQWVPGSSPGGRTRKKSDKPLNDGGFSLCGTSSHRSPLLIKTFELEAQRAV